MWQKMLQSGSGGGSSDFPSPTTMGSIQAYSGRVSNIQGGYTIKGGLCYLDLTFDNAMDRINSTRITGIPEMKYPTYFMCADVKDDGSYDNTWSFSAYYDTSSNFYGIISRLTVQIKKYRIKCIYPTTQADT